MLAAGVVVTQGRDTLRWQGLLWVTLPGSFAQTVPDDIQNQATPPRRFFVIK